MSDGRKPISIGIEQRTIVDVLARILARIDRDRERTQARRAS